MWCTRTLVMGDVSLCVRRLQSWNKQLDVSAALRNVTSWGYITWGLKVVSAILWNKCCYISLPNDPAYCFSKYGSPTKASINNIPLEMSIDWTRLLRRLLRPLLVTRPSFRSSSSSLTRWHTLINLVCKHPDNDSSNGVSLTNVVTIRHSEYLT